MMCAGVAVALHERCDFGRCRLRTDEEGVAEPGGTIDGARRRGADPDLQRLGWYGSDVSPVDLPGSVDDRHGLTSAQRPHDFERGLEARCPLAQRRVEYAELLLARADRALQNEGATRDRGEGADLLREQDRMPQRQEEQRTRGPVVPLCEQTTEDRDVLVIGHRDVVVIADEEGVEARIGRRSRPLDHPLGAEPRVHRRIPAPQRHADLHGSLAAPSWLRCVRTVFTGGSIARRCRHGDSRSRLGGPRRTTRRTPRAVPAFGANATGVEWRWCASPRVDLCRSRAHHLVLPGRAGLPPRRVVREPRDRRRTAVVCITSR